MTNRGEGARAGQDGESLLLVRTNWWRLGLLHHLINVGWGHGSTSVSLFSAPNPVAFGR